MSRHKYITAARGDLQMVLDEFRHYKLVSVCYDGVEFHLFFTEPE